MIESRIEIHVCNVGVHALLQHCVVFSFGEREGGGVAIIIIILFEVSIGCFLP